MDAITYDLLFDVLRYEKNKEDLQPLDREFYIKVVEYLKFKDDILLNSQTTITERELTRIQLNNIKKILKELYERRERKIINLALYRIKTGSEMMNTANMLEEEKGLFESIYNVLFEYKNMIIDNVLANINPQMHKMEIPDTDKKLFAGSHDAIRNALDNDIPESEDSGMDNPALEGSIKSIRFTRPVPRFLGPNLETYGPFEEQDIASLPGQIARILVKKERAEEIQAQ